MTYLSKKGSLIKTRRDLAQAALFFLLSVRRELLGLDLAILGVLYQTVKRSQNVDRHHSR